MSSKQRGKGDGTIRERSDGRWEARLRYIDPVTGLSQRDSFYGATRDDVAAELRKAQDRVAQGRPPRDESIVLSVYLEHWLENVVKTTRKVSTYRGYRQIVKAVINPSPLGSKTLRELRAPMIQAVLCKAGTNGRSRALALSILKRALLQAVRWDLMRDNPASFVEPPRFEKREMHVWTAAEARRFLRTAESDRYFAVYYLALHTAMRQGEILGLQWSDVDLKRSRVRVARTLDPIERTLSSPKTSGSRRTISIGSDVVEILKAHQKPGNGQGYVFTGESGEPVAASNLRRRSFAPLIKKAKVPVIRFHDLRHTAATLMLENDVPLKVVSERLGHFSSAFTADTYQHVSAKLERTAATKMTSLLSPRKTSGGRAKRTKAGGPPGGQVEDDAEHQNAKNPAN